MTRRRSASALALSLLIASISCGGSNEGSSDTAGGSGAGSSGNEAGSGTAGDVPTSGGNGLAGSSSDASGGADSPAGGSDSASGGSENAEGGSTSGSGGSENAEGGSATATGGSSTGSGGSSQGASSGCGISPPDTPPDTVEVGGTRRTFIVDVPAGYSPEAPTPVIFGFHGMSTSGELFRSQFYGNLLSGFGDDYIVVHPDALGDPTAWETSGGDDVLFFDAIRELLTATYCIDDERVFATGHSSGGFFTNTLGCQRGDVLRGIGPVSGGGPFTFGGTSCTGQVAAWIAHANNDETVDVSNGESSRDHWAEANGCDTSQSTAPSAGDPCIEYVGCDPGFPVRWCEYEDGHNWPSFAPQSMHDFFSGL